MNPAKIRYILSGLKKEIARERSYVRRAHLADMGLFYTQLLMECA